MKAWLCWLLRQPETVSLKRICAETERRKLNLCDVRVRVMLSALVPVSA
jgi:hypothetical protein